MKKGNHIRKDVMDELKWQPLQNSSKVGVAVKNRIVSLSGIVDFFSNKLSAERAAKNVAGAKAIADDIKIGVSPAYWRTDADEKIKVTMDGGNVTLEGELEWEYQRINARTPIQYLSGVRSVFHLIWIKQKLNPFELEQKISSAFGRNATVDACKVSVSRIRNAVILNGKVRPLAESEDAENVAWKAPDVNHVENKLIIEEPELVY